jgi:hypothetical protein
MTSHVSKPTLTYFNVSGRAELSRILLEDAGADYDFVTLTNWAEQKPQLTATGIFLLSPYGVRPQPITQ